MAAWRKPPPGRAARVARGEPRRKGGEARAALALKVLSPKKWISSKCGRTYRRQYVLSQPCARSGRSARRPSAVQPYCGVGHPGRPRPDCSRCLPGACPACLTTCEPGGRRPHPREDVERDLPPHRVLHVQVSKALAQCSNKCLSAQQRSGRCASRQRHEPGEAPPGRRRQDPGGPAGCRLRGHGHGLVRRTPAP